MAGPQTYACGLDGSKLSWLAFEFATNLMDRRQAGDTLSVLHVAAPAQKKNLVPATLRPEQLESGVSDRNVKLRLPIKFLQQDRSPGEKAGNVLISMAEHAITDELGNTMIPDGLIIGSFGRKEKDSQYLGHVPDALLKNANMDVFIVKQRPQPLPPKPEPITWVVGTDNSPHAKHALDTTLSLMGPEDVVHVFYAAKFESFAKRVEATQEEIWTKAERNGKFEFEHVMGQVNYGDVLCNYAKRKRADVLVIGHGGHSASKVKADGEPTAKLGSVTEHCASEVGCALLITKGEGRWSLGDDVAKAAEKAADAAAAAAEPEPEPEEPQA